MHYLVKISRLGPKAVVNGIALGADKVAAFDVPAGDFLSPSSFPFTAPAATSPPTTATSNAGASEADTAADAATALKDCFISAGRIGDLSALMKINILQKLVPGLAKEGQETSAHEASPAHAAPRPEGARRDEDDDFGGAPAPARPHPLADPLAAGPPRRPPVPAGEFAPPGFEDEHGVLRPPGRGGLFPGEDGGRQPPMGIGERDLYPPGLGPHDPLRIGGPRAGGGGMHPTFDDPMFGGRGGSGGYDPR